MSGEFELAPGKMAHPSGALWLAESGVLMLADAFFGYGWARRSRQDQSPVFDGGAHQRLGVVVEELKPKSVILLGDAEHAPRLDCEFAGVFRHFRMRMVDGWSGDDVVALYGRLPSGAVPHGHTLIFGHVHPVATYEDATGTRRRLPAFLRSRRTIVLPAFSPFPGGLDVSRGITGELRELMGHGPVQVAVTTGRRVMPLRLAGG